MQLRVIGDGNTGKTVLLYAYMKQGFDEMHIPTVLDTYHAKEQVNGLEVTLEIFDTAGQEDFSQIRTLVYPGTDVFLMCYSCVLISSVTNIEHFWAPEIYNIDNKVPILLVGNKMDLAEEDPSKFISESIIINELLSTSSSLVGRENFKAAMRCSAKLESLGKEGNVQQVFKKAVSLGATHSLGAIDSTGCLCCQLF